MARTGLRFRCIGQPDAVQHAGLRQLQNPGGTLRFSLTPKRNIVIWGNKRAAARAYLKQEGVQFLSDGVIYDPNGVLILVRGEPPNN